MATLTYDPAEPQEGEFTPEEQENIKVGEALEEQQNQLLAGKFEDAKQLEDAYVELQRKLGSPKEEPSEEPEEPEETEPEEKEEEENIDTSFLEKLWDEANDKFTDETIKELSDMDPRALAQMHLQYRAENQSKEVPPLTTETVTELKSVAGGEENYGTMIGWAKENLQEKEIQMYDKVMEGGDPLACFFAVQALKYRYDDESGTEGRMLTGKAPTPAKGDTFRSQAEVVRAMSDSKYDNDPAYRQDVFNKLERSNIEF